MPSPSRPADPSPLALLRDHRATRYPPDPIPEILPGGGVSLIAGASGTGKTAFLAWLTTRFRDHLPIFSHQPTIIPCQAILAIDRSWIQSTSKWFEAVGFPEILAYSPLDDPEFKADRMRFKKNRLAILNEHLDKLCALYGGPLPRGTIVYVDPMAPFLGGNLLDYDACSVACMEIREIGRLRGVTFMGTAHTAKLKADKKDRYARVQDRILGSAALLGYTDTQMFLASPDETESDHYQFFWNPHHARSQTFDLGRDPNTGLFVPYEAAPVAHPELQATLLSLLAASGEPIAYATLVAAASTSDASVHRALTQLLKDGRVRKAERGQYVVATVS